MSFKFFTMVQHHQIHVTFEFESHLQIFDLFMALF